MNTEIPTEIPSVRQFATPVIGALNGALIALPLSTDSAWILLTLTIMGGLIGYKKRHHTGFFYFSLLAFLVLSGLLLKQLT